MGHPQSSYWGYSSGKIIALEAHCRNLAPFITAVAFHEAPAARQLQDALVAQESKFQEMLASAETRHNAALAIFQQEAENRHAAALKEADAHRQLLKKAVENAGSLTTSDTSTIPVENDAPLSTTTLTKGKGEGQTDAGAEY